MNLWRGWARVGRECMRGGQFNIICNAAGINWLIGSSRQLSILEGNEWLREDSRGSQCSFIFAALSSHEPNQLSCQLWIIVDHEHNRWNLVTRRQLVSTLNNQLSIIVFSISRWSMIVWVSVVLWLTVTDVSSTTCTLIIFTLVIWPGPGCSKVG